MSTTTLEATVEPDNPEPPAATWIERITVEELLYAAILVLSLIVRWIGLGHRLRLPQLCARGRPAKGWAPYWMQAHPYC